MNLGALRDHEHPRLLDIQRRPPRREPPHAPIDLAPIATHVGRPISARTVPAMSITVEHPHPSSRCAHRARTSPLPWRSRASWRALSATKRARDARFLVENAIVAPIAARRATRVIASHFSPRARVRATTLSNEFGNNEFAINDPTERRSRPAQMLG
jgi:hypothetical protein